MAGKCFIPRVMLPAGKRAPPRLRGLLTIRHEGDRLISPPAAPKPLLQVRRGFLPKSGGFGPCLQVLARSLLRPFIAPWHPTSP